MQTVGSATNAQITPEQILWLSILATAGLVLMWGLFWLAEVLLSPAFFRTVAVMGVIAATVVLSLAGRSRRVSACALVERRRLQLRSARKTFILSLLLRAGDVRPAARLGGAAG